MPIMVMRCFETVTPESAKQGEVADSGIMGESLMTASEVAAEIQGAEPSCHPLRAQDIHAHVWATIDCGTNYRTGEERRESLHLHDPRPSALRAWRAAFKAAGLTQ